MKAKKTAKADLNNKRGLFFQVGLAVSLLATIGFFTWSQPAVSVETLDFETAVDIYELPPITFDEPEKTETAMPKIVPIVDIINIVRDDIKIESSEVDPFDIDPNELFVFGPIGQPGSGNPEALQPDVFDFMVIEDQPLFQGKDLKAFRQWIMKNIDYPSMAAENGVQGRVTIQFVVDRHGNLDDIKVLASPHRSLSDEAVRILKNSSGDWTPGKQRGNPVAVRFTIPVDFKLQ